ncbi:MAG: glycosyltransferase family 4 protein [Solirubrobacteraceae bacterium]
MRVLLLHNRYRAAGGEERAVADIAALLARRGHAVEVLERCSDEATRARAARGMMLGGVDGDEVAAAVRRMRAEVVHAHNLHPLFGWRALAAARAAGARTVVHLHNFRLFCSIAIAYRDGAPCFRCRGANTLPGLRLRCRGQIAETVIYAAGLHHQQAHLYAHADRFVVVSEATARRLIELGLPATPTVALANFVPATSFADCSRAGEGEYALAAGRLVPEKGFDTAIAAADRAGVPLVIAGAGPDEERLRRLAQGADVRFTGRLDPDVLARVREQAGVVLAPSRWEEPCPYAVLDALAAGVPVRVSDRGGLPELVERHHVLPAQEPGAWAASLAALWRDPGARRAQGHEALARARSRFGEDRYHEALMAVYADA